MFELQYPITSNLMTLIVFVNHIFRTECSRRCDMKLSHFRILANIARHSDARPVHSIAQELRLSDSTITTTVKQMEGLGLAYRKPADNDRRIVLVDKTPLGTERMEAVEHMMAQIIVDLWKPLSAEEKQTLMQGTAKIDHTQNAPHDFSRQIRTVTAYVNVYLYTLDAFLEAVKRCDLTIHEFRILFELQEHQQGISAKRLGDILLLKPNEITKATDSLADRELIFRKRSEVDHRHVIVELSSEGFALLSKAAPIVDSAFLLNVCNTSSEECAHYLNIADTIISAQQRS